MFCLGAMREIVVLSFAIALFFAVLSDNGSIRKLWSQPDELKSRKDDAKPVLNMVLDQDTQTLIVHSFPESLDEIPLKSGSLTRHSNVQFLVGCAIAERNSTRIHLLQWADDSIVRHAVLIFRNQELLVSEQFAVAPGISADVRISADGSTAIVVSHQGLITGWDLMSPDLVRWQFQLDHPVHTSSLSPDGMHLFISDFEGPAQICDPRSGQLELTLDNVLRCSRSTAWSANSQYVAAGQESGTIRLYDISTGKQVWQQKLPLLFPRSIALSANAEWLAAGGFDKTIRVWNLSDSSASVIKLRGEPAVVHNLVFTNLDRTLLSGSSDGSIREWSLSDRKQIRQLW
jgi:WD40 repeat protein